MFSRFLIAWLLMALSVALHATGLTAALRRIERRPVPADARFWSATWTMIGVAAWVVFLHLVEIAAWASFYALKEALPDLPSALYFSAVTYTTTGYGDVVLPPPWRLVGAIEALTGILMCGWSTGFFFALVSRLHDSQQRPAGPGAGTPVPP